MVTLAKKIYDSLDDQEVQNWIKIIKQGRECKNQIATANSCKDVLLNLDFRSIVQSNYTDFDSMRAELNKGWKNKLFMPSNIIF